MAFAAPLKSQGLESIFKNQFIRINLPESSQQDIAATSFQSCPGVVGGL